MSSRTGEVKLDADATSGGSRRSWPWAAAVVLLAVGLFLPFLNTGPFVNGADSVLRLSLVSHWRNIPTLFTQDFMIFTDGQYRPFSYALLALVRSFVPADNTLFWHAWLVGFHALNAVLVFGVARRFARKVFPAFVAGAVFAAHPLASVFGNGMNQFHYVLAGSFALGAFLCYAGFVRSRRRWLYATALLLFVCGLLTSKMLLTLPVVLLVYGLLYERSGVLTTLKRLLPFGVFCAAVAPCWLVLRPHPVHYAYPAFPPDAGWFSLYTFVGRTGAWVKGVVAGLGFEVPPAEATRRIMIPLDTSFLGWGAAILLALVLAVHELLRKNWLGIGVFLAVLSVVPYVSVVFHRTPDFLCWDYMYVVVTGFALVVGALADAALRQRRLPLRAAAVCLSALLVVYYGTLLVRANFNTRSARDYWRHVLELHPRSETAAIELGRVLLAEGRYKEAVAFLFRPSVKDIAHSSLIMAEYYAERGELLASAVHFQNAVAGQTSDLHVQNRIQMVGARLVHAAGALDYVEQAMTMLLMGNPYDTAAMRLLAEVLARKGYVRAALRYLEEAGRLDPGDTRTTMQIARLKLQMAHPEASAVATVKPPSPAWLWYVMAQRMNARIAGEVIALSEHLVDDPLIQARAGECLLGQGEFERARRKLDMAVRYMPSHPYVWACKRRADLEAGALAEAGPEQRTALSRDAAMWNDMGYLLYLQGKHDQAVSAFRAALKIDPNSFRAHSNLGLVLMVQDRYELAIGHYRRAIALVPTDPEPYRSLASAFTRLSRFAECIEVLSDGLKAIPDNQDLRLRLAWSLVVAPEARLRDGARAVELAESACRHAEVRNARALNILAAAYAETGRFEEAVRVAAEAVALARSERNEQLVRTGEARLKLYRQRRPYRPNPAPSRP